MCSRCRGWRPPQCPIDLMSVIQKVTALKTETKHYKDVDDIAAEVDKRLHRKGMPSTSKAYVPSCTPFRVGQRSQALERSLK